MPVRPPRVTLRLPAGAPGQVLLFVLFLLGGDPGIGKGASLASPRVVASCVSCVAAKDIVRRRCCVCVDVGQYAVTVTTTLIAQKKYAICKKISAR